MHRQARTTASSSSDVKGKLFSMPNVCVCVRVFACWLVIILLAHVAKTFIAIIITWDTEPATQTQANGRNPYSIMRMYASTRFSRFAIKRAAVPFARIFGYIGGHELFNADVLHIHTERACTCACVYVLSFASGRN